MKKNTGIRLIFISILIIIFFIPLYPTIKWVSLDKDKRDKAELEFEDNKKYLELFDDERAQIDKYKKIKNKSIKLGLDLQGGMYIVLKADITNQKSLEDQNDVVNRALEVIRNRVDQFRISEPSIMRQGKNRIIVELPGVKDPKRAEALLNVRGKLEFKLVDKELSKEDNFEDIQKGILKTNIKISDDKELLPVWEKNEQTQKLEQRYWVIVDKQAALSGDALKSARMEMGQFGDATVNFELKSEGAEAFYNVTKDNVGESLAIVLDGKVRSHPNIKEPLRDRGQITGSFTVQEAQDLSLLLRAGAIPVELEIMEKRIVGASLGEDSIKAGVNAGLLGLVLVVAFMLIYYKLSGVIANFTLFLNMFFLVSILQVFGFTLTLPGLAGIILTIGMAVDANVLIFERIKEEIRTGKSLSASIDAGFEKAYRTILDANVTTLITAFILSQLGTGPIKGFAYTLLIGVSANLFTAVYVSHNIFNYIVQKFNMHKISI